MNVLIERQKGYNPEEVYGIIKRMFESCDLAGKLSGKERILVKPNLLGPFSPEKAVTTHPVIVEAVVRILLEMGKKVTVGDSPGGTSPINGIYKATGLEYIKEKYPIEFVCFTKSGFREISHNGIDFYITKPFFEADAVINLAKYKTHGLMLYTGCVKNLYGLIPGLSKATYHKQFPRPFQFTEVLHALYDYTSAKIAFNVLDGIWGMEGEGPSAGTRRDFGVIFGGEKASAIDCIASGMMGYSLKQVEYLQKALEVDRINPDSIVVSSEFKGFKFRNVDIKKVLRKSFLFNRLPKSLEKIIRLLFRYHPDFNDKCRMCGVCVESCPVDAMILNKEEKKPVIDFSKCINCLCCHEMCPHHAVYIRKSMVAKLFIR